ncbi:hypothetical protein [Sphingomonas sp. Leaf242]|uniref:hypothetical protein n=1 Tax=Sphingomonas sp. Leaf242 TaxID=1736304 RepID=UPI000713997D|nr:hypothetical protein [Sphingomonas sp. Leaf242]KQO09028.1 hypothetical protein ASF09_04900 [Sphingomonas sp. Leaf242]
MAADVIFQRDLHRLVEINRPADLATRIGKMVLLVDRCAFNLQKDALCLVREQSGRFAQHRREAGNCAIPWPSCR